jgi:uncharacterized FlaG/YvyC family protein
MGIESLANIGPETLKTANAVRASAPQLRANEEALKAKESPRPEKEPSEEQARQVAKTAATAAPSINGALPRFRMDAGTKQIVAQMVDENNEVIRQIPSEELLKIAAKFRHLEGVLFDQKT